MIKQILSISLILLTVSFENASAQEHCNALKNLFLDEKVDGTYLHPKKSNPPKYFTEKKSIILSKNISFEYDRRVQFSRSSKPGTKIDYYFNAGELVLIKKQDVSVAPIAGGQKEELLVQVNNCKVKIYGKNIIEYFPTPPFEVSYEAAVSEKLCGKLKSHPEIVKTNKLTSNPNNLKKFIEEDTDNSYLLSSKNYDPKFDDYSPKKQINIIKSICKKITPWISVSQTKTSGVTNTTTKIKPMVAN
ncbi:MAG: hypothetical protein HOO06_06395 [Bdellovibrionaceae bacterium]|jgi:hypothetical protein|nr:hypothetical protein [Pseudobdellovibrionaceae bacterium]